MLNEGLKEYKRKVANGEITKTKTKQRNPTEQWEDNPTSLRKSINAYCYDCGGFNINEVRLCPAKKCPLWKIRPYQTKE